MRRWDLLLLCTLQGTVLTPGLGADEPPAKAAIRNPYFDETEWRV